jgi:hypothetical protein
MYRRNDEAAERMKKRKAAEDDAPRLVERVPSLKSLRLSYAYRRADMPIGDSAHTRVVVVERAPALFVVPCADKDCKDGGHDITSLVMDALRQKKEKFEGTDPCHGALGSAGTRCSGVLTFEGAATYE